jgi:hypothetical protein
MRTTVASRMGFGHKDIAGTQSLVSAVAISGIIEIQPIPTSNEADMSS